MGISYLDIRREFAEVGELHGLDAVEAHQSLLLLHREAVHLFCRI